MQKQEHSDTIYILTELHLDAANLPRKAILSLSMCLLTDRQIINNHYYDLLPDGIKTGNEVNGKKTIHQETITALGTWLNKKIASM